MLIYQRVHNGIYYLIISYIILYIYITLRLFNIAMKNSLKLEVLMGKSSVNGSFSIAMLNSQRVNII